MVDLPKTSMQNGHSSDIEERKQAFYEYSKDVHSLLEQKSASFEQKYLVPAKNAFARTASAYPFSTLLLTLFIVLAFFPLVSFIGFCICAGSIIIPASIAFGLFWASIFIGSAFMFLVGALMIVTSVSVSVTAMAAFSALVYTAVINVKEYGSLRKGLKATYRETKAFVKGTAKPGEQLSGGPASAGNQPTLDGYLVAGHPGVNGQKAKQEDL